MSKTALNTQFKIANYLFPLFHVNFCSSIPNHFTLPYIFLPNTFNLILSNVITYYDYCLLSLLGYKLKEADLVCAFTPV